MTPITTSDIRNELEEVKTVEDFEKLLRKYPTRLSASILFMIDSEIHVPSGDWAIDPFTGKFDTEHR